MCRIRMRLYSRHQWKELYPRPRQHKRLCGKIGVQRSITGHYRVRRYMCHILCWYHTASSVNKYQTSNLLRNTLESLADLFLSDTTVLEITGPGYDKLESCGKWCLNGCLDSNGTRLENCGPNFYPPNWGDFHGLAADQDCSTPDCMCNAANFDSAVAKLIESSRGFCGWPVSKPQAPFPPYDNMHSVFVNWCLRMGYAHHNYTAVIVGAAPVGNFSVANGTSGSTNTTTANTVVLVKSKL